MPEALTPQVIAYLLVFARVGSMLMVMPVLGDEQVPARVRLIMALAICFVILPVIMLNLPPTPATATALLGQLVSEILLGIALGGGARIMFNALSVAGSVIALQSGLASASILDPSLGGQTVVVARFMGMIGMIMILATNTHHLLLAALVRSYSLFAPAPLPAGDFAMMAIRLVSQCFALGIQISAPFLLYGLLFNVGLGLMARLAPTMQVFFIAQPLSILLSFMLLLVLIGTMMTVFIDRYADALRPILGG
ncbi:flagellar type III secretion system protein FliR [Hankyongella ginsenosidimutans]|uniref:Flagellar biosynthetic protein FliR n=1 Tax=Hankyongella ginsenosidimutans TaxID=1763828 RepID=A0A4D7CCB8_9SPHN|nr:flagellar biosynthetic protein FliR [Hankyongella ginsenosidimutans]QCI80282.1 flagellar type III secretion system protein FliR [Hankyongella ginsenosidimutans]